MKKQFLFFILLVLILKVNAQLLPANLNCTDSKIWLKTNYYNGIHQTLGYSLARKKMYAYIDNHNDSVECVYSGFKVYNAYGNEITFPAPVNTEHSVPQSFFSSMDPMLSDIHHLFPSYDLWNTDRGSNPFMDIPDNNTVKWVINNYSQSNIPSNNIDGYSEYRPTDYEPRESHKGDLARALAYFYTMYPSVGPLTDVISLNTMLQWNTQDPPNQDEIDRNNAIAFYQGNRNPYIDYPSWMIQAFVCNISIADVDLASNWSVYPNPAKDILFVKNELAFTQGIISVYSMSGTLVYSQKTDDTTTQLDISKLNGGVYILQYNAGTFMFQRKIVVIR
ncbi:MAG: endonuclease [Bacteroidetes bacterium]|nr:endonuclease [Bacteroidota bacterium]